MSQDASLPRPEKVQPPEDPRSAEPPPSLPQIHARGERIYRELREMLREVLRRKKVLPSLARKVRLALEADVDPGEDAAGVEGLAAARRFSEELLGRMHQLAQECCLGEAPFPPGRLYCFWCGSFECGHSEPPEPRAVFTGYTPTGQPIWLELGAVALEKHHPLIDSIYRESPLPITLVQAGSSLTREQLSVYGKFSGIYRILGQVLAGYFLLADRSGNRTRVALTIQAVETEGPRRRYHLNILGTLPGGQPIGPFVEEVADSRLADALATARGKLAELSLYGSAPPAGKDGAQRPSRRRRRRHGYRAREEKVFRILNRLAQGIDKIYRQSTRRTLHARSRHRDRERPASTALRDALHAGAESIFRDVQEGTWVVVGPRTRVHVFNDRGQHITSVVYPGETIRKRTTLGKWRAASPEDIEAFRARLRESAASGS